MDNIRTLSINVLPTFWETGWAWLLYVILFVLFTGSIVYVLFYIYRLRHQVDIEQQLSNIKLRFFTDISHELRTPLTLISSPVNEVLETLDNAEGWSTWDVMGGGLMADLAKYEELDDAQEQIEQLQVELRRFKTELSDVEIAADLQVTVNSFLKFADFFFDGLFADWAVLDHINQAQSRVENTKGQIKRVLALLKKMREDVDVQIADEKEKQEQLAVETEL